MSTRESLHPKPNHFLRTLSIFLILALPAGALLAAGGVSPGGPDGVYSQTDVVLLVTYILLALVFSFLCSVAEAVLLSITPSYIAGLKESNPKRASLLRKLKQENVDQSLAAILTLNTIAHTVGAIGSGSKATAVFGSAWFGVFSAVMTLLILFLSEIIPKTLGAVHWRRLAGLTALFVRGLILCLYPLIWISEKLTQLLSGGAGHHAFNREEFIAMAGIGAESGQIEEHESWILKNLFRLRSLRAKDIMTPRTVIQAFQETQTVDEALEVNTPFSRLPIFTEDRDDIHGFVLKGDVLLAKSRGEGGTPLLDLKRDILSVPQTAPLSKLLETFLDRRRHLALVVNEYGGTAGLVTLEDLVETLVGQEIVDEMDRVEDMQALARPKWAKRAEALGLDVEAAGDEG